MEQRLYGASIVCASNYYSPLVGRNLGTSGSYVHTVIPAAGTIDEFYVYCTAPGVGYSWTIALYINGSPSGITVTIADANTSGSDLAHSASVSAGDIVYFSITEHNPGGGNVTFQYSTRFTGSTAGQSLILGNAAGILNSAARYHAVQGISGQEATEADAYQVVPTDGTIKNLYVVLHTDPGTSPDAYTFTLRKNGADTALTVTIVANDVTGSDTNAAHAVDVAPGDLLSLLVTPVSGPATQPRTGWGMVFVSDTDGESLILGGSPDNLNASTTEYNALCEQSGNWSSTSTNLYYPSGAVTIKKLYVSLSASPYVNSTSEDKYTFTARLDGADTALTTGISDDGTGNKVGYDNANSFAVTGGQLLNIKCVPASTPAVVDAYWSVVGYISGGYSLSANSGSFAVAGTAATLKATRKLTVASGSFSEAGTAAALKYAREIAAGSGSFVVSGTDATLTYGEITGYTLDAGGGAFLVQAPAAGLFYARKIAAVTGSFEETGTAAALIHAYNLTVGAGAVTYAGTTAILKFDRVLVAGSGAFTESGTIADLSYSGAQKTMGASSGTFSVSGTALDLLRDALLAAGIGAFEETGTAAGLYKTSTILSAESGSFYLGGNQVNLIRNALLAAVSGEYLVSNPHEAVMRYGMVISAGSGTYTVGTGSATYFPRPGSSRICYTFQKRRDHFRV